MKTNKIENRKTEKFNETKSRFFKKLSDIDKPLARHNRKKGEKTQITQLKNGSGDIATNLTEAKKVVREHYKCLCAGSLNHLHETEIPRHSHPPESDSRRNKKSK